MSEPDAQSEISRLFATDPLKLTREDRKPMIEYYREQRARYLNTGKGTLARASTAKAKPDTKGLPDLELDLGDL